MKWHVLTFIFVMAYHVSTAQYFNQVSSWSVADNAYQILDDNGELVIQGTYLNYVTVLSGGMFFRKLDYAGNEICSKMIIIDSVQMDTQLGGNLRKWGNTYITSGIFKKSGLPVEMMVVWWDLNCDTISIKRYPYMEGCRGRNLQLLENGDLLVFGDCSTIPSSSASVDLTVWKINAQGNLLWVQHYPYPGGDFALSGSIDDEGNMYISGGNNTTTATRGLIIKVDSNGNHIWTKLFPQCFGIMHTFSKGFLLASSGIVVGSGGFEHEVYYMKLDTSGNIIFSQQYSSLPYASSYVPPYRVDDKVFIAGTQYPSGSPFKGWLCLLDTLGQVQFSRSYDSSPVGEHRITAMTPTSDGGFAMAGYAVLPGQGQDHWVLKVDSLGCLVPNCALSEEELPTTNELRLWPNPTTGILNIMLPQSSSPAEVYLTDITGHVVHHEWLSAGIAELVLDMNELPPGMYFLQVRGADGSLVTEKVVKQ